MFWFSYNKLVYYYKNTFSNTPLQHASQTIRPLEKQQQQTNKKKKKNSLLKNTNKYIKLNILIMY